MTNTHKPSRVAALEHRALAMESLLYAERRRVDVALAGIEGVLDEIEPFHAARATAAYQQVFDAPDPLVSVCVATVNRPGLLIERCLRSLREQSYRNLQIVVVGDHCTDDTGYRIAQLRDDRIVFHNLPARGPYPRPGMPRWQVAGSNAMNHALSLCEGAFITHLDDDDAAVSDRIATLVAAAQASRADFCWHPMWYERPDGTWLVIGNGHIELGHISTGAIFYHRYLARFPWDVRAFRLDEPGDWNRLRKIRALRPNTHYIDRPLVYHYAEGSQPKFVQQDGETFLE